MVNRIQAQVTSCLKMADSLQEGILLILLQAAPTHGITDWFKIGQLRQAPAGILLI